MTETLRDLARQAKATGTVQDAARLLAERLRRGEECGAYRQLLRPDGVILTHCPACAGLTLQQRAGLAAYAGDEASRMVVGAADVVGDRHASKDYKTLDEASLEYWARGLSRWGKTPCVRAAVAAGREALAAWETCPHGDPQRCDAFCYRNARRALDATQAWLDCPCSRHWDEWFAHVEDLAALEWVVRPGVVPSEWRENARWAIGGAARLTDEAAVRSAIREALVPWALGSS